MLDTPMMVEPILWWLSALILLPVSGAVAVVLLPGRIRASTGVAFAVSGVTLLAALGAAGAGSVSIVNAVGRVPSLGVSVVFGMDGLSAILVVWVALACLSCLGVELTRPHDDGFSSAAVLCVAASMFGLLVARDAFLLLGFYGALVVALAVVSTVPSRVIAWQSAGLSAVVGIFLLLYRGVFAQTGFPSTELSRWVALVLYPDEQVMLFIGLGVSVSLLLPLLPSVWTDAPVSSRVLLLSSAGIVSSYWFLTLVLPLAGAGAPSVSGIARALALSLGLVAALVGGWPALFLGYQGLFLFGVLSLNAGGVVGAELLLVGGLAGFSGLLLSDRRALRVVFAVFLSGLPIVAIIVPAWATAWGGAAAASVVTMIIAHRLLKLLADPPVEMPSWRGLLLTLPALLWCASLVFGMEHWRSVLLPTVHALLQSAVEGGA